MNDQPTTPHGHDDRPDPVVVFALRSMAPPEHGPGFWDRLEGRLSDGPVTAPTAAVPPPEPPAPPAPPDLPAPPPLAEVVPLPPRRPRPPRWWIPVAAALAVALGVAALVRTTSSTDVETTTAATGLPIETTMAPTTSAPAPTTAAPTTVAAKPAAAPTTTRPATTTTRAVALSASPAGLGPLKLGMTAKQAEATGAVGPFQDPLETGGACGHAEPAGTYRAGDFGALFLDGRLARLYIDKGSRVRTPQGLGVGSPASKLSSVPGTRSESPHPYGGGTNVDIMSGDVGYQFTVDQGVVQTWSVGTTAGLSLPEGCA